MNAPGRFIVSGTVVLLSMAVLFTRTACAQDPVSRPFKTLSIAEGLPQSFISGLVQDSVGFVWIATRDGLARYDGRKFKLFQHKQGDTATLASNIIETIYLDKRGQLWILYETGDIDMLHTASEQLFHFSKHPAYGIMTGLVKPGNSIAEDIAGNLWFLGTNGGVFIYNHNSSSLRFFSEQKLQCTHNKITGIAPYRDHIALITDTALVVMSAEQKVLSSKPYSFPHPRLYDSTRPWKDTYALTTENGDLVIKDLHRLLVYRAAQQDFKEVLPPPKNREDGFHLARDEKGKILIVYPGDLYTLPGNETMAHWKSLLPQPETGFISVIVDHSGILWLGGNGSGIQLHQLRPSGFTGTPYQRSYHEDILEKYLHVSTAEIKNSFLGGMYAYFFRSFNSRDGKIWMYKSTREASKKPALLYYAGGHLVKPAWTYGDSPENAHVDINALAQSRSGKLWGVDFFLHPVFFDTSSLEATVYPAITKTSQQYNNSSVSSMLIDGEDRFWITTALDGLYFYNHSTRELRHYTAADTTGSLPTNQLMNMVQDPGEEHILWIGSLGGGLIRFNKITGTCRVFNMQDGLPNNTIYCVVADSAGNLWCSTNKGIFSFNRKTAAIRSFTYNDGLPCDEFNRYHYFQLPDGRLSFGGIEGYTVFSPEHISDDDFQPAIALTGISINNQQKDYGFPGSPFAAAINSLSELRFPYNQNFLSFEMAALQFSITSKIQYRYMLEGFDKQWVYAGTNNMATYTNIPPGKYRLRVNATNTAGKWSSHFKTLTVVITPPFWKTAWFTTLAILAAGGLIYLFVYLRIKAVRKEEQQAAIFERQATALKEQALRAQMNPHFIFNCLNSIKALIQEDNKKQAVLYLTTFSRLIRNQLSNAQELISLHAELETCKLYFQLEALRFGDSITSDFVIDQQVDLFSVQVPPLIVQPFIENAIWHGILPGNGGKVTVSVRPEGNYIVCLIDDNGIGRQMSMNSKKDQSSTYESKGMKLVQHRLNLYNTISRYGGTADVVDKKDAQGNACGTQIILTFKQEQ